MSDFLEIKLDNKEIEKRLLLLAEKGKNTRPLMKNIAGVFAYSTEENFKAQGRPEWTELKESTIKQRIKNKHWPGQILQVKGKLAASVTTAYDENSAMIGSNFDYAAIHQAGGKAGKNKNVQIVARPYINIQKEEQEEILEIVEKYISDI